MAYSVTSALVASLIFSLTLVPLLCFYLLRRNLPSARQRAGRALQENLRARAGVGARSQEAGRAVGGGRACRESGGGAPARHRIPAGTQRGIDVAQRAAAPERIGDRGVDRDGAHAGRAEKNPRSQDRGLQGRPSRGRHRSETDQHGGDPGGFEARIGMDAPHHQARSHARDGPGVVEDSRRAGEFFAADPRQHTGEHFADRRPDRGQDLRRRPGRIARECGQGAGRDCRCAGGRARHDRPPGRIAADPDRDRPCAGGTLRFECFRYRGCDRNGARRQGCNERVGRREAIRRGGAAQGRPARARQAAEHTGDHARTGSICRCRRWRKSAPSAAA